MKDKAYKELINVLGEEKTILDTMTYELIVDGMVGEKNKDEQWATYAQMFVEIKKTGNYTLYQKFQYHFTSGDDVRVPVIRLLKELKIKSNELKRLEGKIEGF